MNVKPFVFTLTHKNFLGVFKKSRNFLGGWFLSKASDRMRWCGTASYSKIHIHLILRAFPHNFEETIKNYYGLKISNIFFVKKVLHSFCIFPL